MQFARALLGEDLLQPRGRRVGIEVLHLHLAVVGHLRLEPALAADFHRTHRDPEDRAAAADGLDDLHETVAQDPRADLVLQLRLELELLHLRAITRR